MEYEVLESKDWVESEGMLPSRVVLLKLKGLGTKYSTHIQVKNETDQLSLFWGHYINDLQEALDDFKKRGL